MNYKVKTSEILHEVRRVEDLKEMIETSIKIYGNNVAFKYSKDEKIVEVKYTQLGEDINNLGTALLDLGLKGKKIAVIGSNSYKWCVSYLAVVCGVGVVVPIDKALPAMEIENILRTSEAEAVIFENKYIDTIKQIKEYKNISLKYLISMDKNEDVFSIDELINKGHLLISEGNKTFIEAKIDNKEMSMLLFTSGTTSKSKAVMLSHQNIVSNIMSLSQVLKFREDDILLSFLPIHHTFECTVTFLNGLYNGSCIAICGGLRYILQDLVTYKVSVFATVPLVVENMYKKILKQKELSNNTLTKEQIIASLGGNLRYIVVGAAALSKDIVIGCRELGLEVRHGYGLTETSPVLTVENDKYTNPGSIGFALPGIEIEIDNPDNTGLGEVIARGPNIMLGYYKNQEATDEILKDGWIYTGDLGYVDEEGYIFIAGRKKNVIVLKNGKNIFPEELELLFNNNPLIAETFVYSVEAKDGDQEVRAKIVYNKENIEATYGNISEEEIFKIMEKFKKQINKSLPLYKYVRKIEVTDEPLIKTTTNKIRRAEELKKITA